MIQNVFRIQMTSYVYVTMTNYHEHYFFLLYDDDDENG